MMLRTIAVSLSLTVAAQPGWGADFSDPTWPCVQRKVENLSLGLMWPYPVDPQAQPASDAERADIAQLAGYLSLRRVEIETLKPRVAQFAQTYQGDVEALGLVFASVFDTLSTRRGRIIDGIGDFSLSQIALADQIDKARGEMDAGLAATEPDYDRIDKLEEQLDWDQVIYTDRQRNITYLCETPTLLERRLFGIAQMLQQVAQEPG
ncbi:hypothetical protein ROLI_041980 [Roseobacter fucihabitans]|uniref:Uncharacterized protein n=1 Tax=Roseobacter fucihabitans TaxID=1537242 RepID=A0ABZ2BYB2_9RHOB|nr:hypothetical protein [Roseobacter litoralis]MBC6965077.1 hypothetical protein [Roseobacter litoralis]